VWLPDSFLPQLGVLVTIRISFWCYHRSKPLSVKETVFKLSCNISRSQGLRYFNIFDSMVHSTTSCIIRSTRVRLTRPSGRHLPGLSVSDGASCYPGPQPGRLSLYKHIFQKCGRGSFVPTVQPLALECAWQKVFVKSIEIYKTNKIMKKYQNIF